MFTEGIERDQWQETVALKKLLNQVLKSVLNKEYDFYHWIVWFQLNFIFQGAQEETSAMKRVKIVFWIVLDGCYPSWTQDVCKYVICTNGDVQKTFQMSSGRLTHFQFTSCILEVYCLNLVRFIKYHSFELKS